MRKSLSILLLACFVLISTSVSYISSHAAAPDYQSSQAALMLDQVVLDVIPLEPVFDGDDTENSKCSCKEKAGTTKFVCSVTLAISCDAFALHVPAHKKARYPHIGSFAPQSFVDELKRPPRTSL